MVRGKKKLGYDLKVKLHLKGSFLSLNNGKGLGEYEGANVHVKFKEFTDDGDFEVN